MLADSEKLELVNAALTNIGTGWRNDWSDFDGRSLRSQLDDVKKIKDCTTLTEAEAIVEETREFMEAQVV